VDKLRSLWRCAGCGKCCNTSGFLVDEHEAARLALLAGMSKSEFKRRHTQSKKIEGKWYLSCRQPCLFWTKEIGCLIYKYRPKVCRAFPFIAGVGSDFCPVVARLLKEADGD